MTVIAANLREMAADTLVSIDGGPRCYMTKIFRLDDGSIIGGAGSSPGLDLVLEWLREGAIRGNRPELDELEKVDFNVLWLRQDGLWLYCDTCVPYKLNVRNYAIGCGADVAFVEMRKHKASPAAACKTAAQYVDGCGGRIDVLRI